MDLSLSGFVTYAEKLPTEDFKSAISKVFFQTSHYKGWEI
jgi:hypothetical protein